MITRQFDHEPASAGAWVMQGPIAPTPEAEDFAVGAHPLLRLQRAVGNRWVQRMVQPHETGAATAAPVGAGTLLLGPADDRCERDADRVADMVDRGSAPPSALASRRAHGAGTGGVILPDV